MNATPSSADQVIGRLIRLFSDAMDAAIPAGKIALVDFPDHSNVGDSAIWLGEMAYLKAAGRLPGYHSAIGDFDDQACVQAIGDGPILIHGGGNLGTLWPKHEAFRLHLLETHRGRPIIQMPQSIHYADAEAARAMAAAIKVHGNFTLFVRDQRSLAFAQAQFDCPVHLCPDAAMMLGRQARAAAAVPVLALLRTDHEQAPTGADAVPPGIEVVDWLEESAGQKRYLRLSLKLQRMVSRDPMAMRATRQTRLAEWRLRRGLAMLSRGRTVVTDRLHAHILSLLLDIPHVLLDNSYGKVSGFADQWTSDYEGLLRASTRSEAFEMALSRQPAQARA